ncbi:hypothetical protein GCM10007385_35940 [Tateyamaria omphalii]|uniref:Hint domain-containing protein n=1 Tax=Tateyamaria omphalii TaxID=299262 RepID=UPI00167B2DA8|nr:Hint domain-containing protein [Tateyamaria omphalii]GGX63595.1 hypothetical protein GCM10007385_35940 [Tateyamaria omphalii]
MPDTDIQITEFIYDAPNSVNDNNYEWVEILNTGTGPVDLSNWTLSDAAGASDPIGSVTLAAGQYAVLYNANISQADFETVYGALPAGAVPIPVSSWPSLNNGGDTITLANASSTAIETFTYPDAAGPGESLEVSGPDGAETFTQDTSPTPGALCFAAGSMIATPEGERAVEMLRIGDLVQTEQGHDVKVLWIGRQTVHTAHAPLRMEPVRIAKGALGENVPHHDLVVTADHGMVLDGFVINASALVNGSTIDWVPLTELAERVTYYHVETENHDVILANGAASETFLDMRGRAAFDNFQEYLDLYGTERLIPEMSRARITSPRLLPDSIRQRCARALDKSNAQETAAIRLRA